LLGVATSGSTLFRQIGGSIGVSAFGAIFSNRLSHELAQRLPTGDHVSTAANPGVVRHLPPPIHAPYVASFAAALHPVFIVAAGVAVVAFALTWFLHEVPLRQTAGAAGVGESFASPRDDSSERELERIARSIARGERRELAALVEHWQRPDGRELAPVLRRLAASLVAEIPEETAARPRQGTGAADA
jgi:hypothetical protein